MMPFARPVNLVPSSYGTARSLLKPAGGAPRGSLSVYGGGRQITIVTRPTGPNLGFIDAIVGAIGGLLGQKSASDAAKTAAKYQYKGMELQANAMEKAAEFGYKAESDKAAYAYKTSILEAENASQALNTQRAALIDAQATQLVANTQNGIFRLADSGLVQAGDTVRKFPSSAVMGVALVAGLVLISMNPPKFGKKQKGVGEFFRRDIRRDEGAPDAAKA